MSDTTAGSRDRERFGLQTTTTSTIYRMMFRQKSQINQVYSKINLLLLCIKIVSKLTPMT